MASLRKIHSLICLVQDSELWHISLWNKCHFSCLSGEWRAVRDKREESARGETFTRGRASKKTKKPPLMLSSSARLKSQINLAPVSQDRENSTIRVLAIFKCFYLPCSSFETFKNSNSLFHVLILVYIGKFINLRLIEHIVFSQSKRTLKRSLFYLMVWH